MSPYENLVAYDKLVAFVNDNLDHFMVEFECGPQLWVIEQWTEVVTGCFCIMENIRMYDDVDEAHCMGYDELFGAFVYAHENYCIDDEVHRVVECNDGVMTLLARAVRDEILR